MNPNYDYKGFEAWVKTRPENVQKIARQYVPDSYYTMENGGKCTLHSYDEEEDGTVTLKVDTVDGFIFEHRVFGVKPETLTKAEYIT